LYGKGNPIAFPKFILGDRFGFRVMMKKDYAKSKREQMAISLQFGNAINVKMIYDVEFDSVVIRQFCVGRRLSFRKGIPDVDCKHASSSEPKENTWVDITAHFDITLGVIIVKRSRFGQTCFTKYYEENRRIIVVIKNVVRHVKVLFRIGYTQTSSARPFIGSVCCLLIYVGKKEFKGFVQNENSEGKKSPHIKSSSCAPR
jgi:hypothetical protein